MAFHLHSECRSSRRLRGLVRFACLDRLHRQEVERKEPNEVDVGQDLEAQARV
jgi:hypothetical protein